MDLVWFCRVLRFLGYYSCEISDCLHLIYFFIVSDPFVFWTKLAELLHALYNLLWCLRLVNLSKLLPILCHAFQLLFQLNCLGYCVFFHYSCYVFKTAFSILKLQQQTLGLPFESEIVSVEAFRLKIVETIPVAFLYFFVHLRISHHKRYNNLLATWRDPACRQVINSVRNFDSETHLEAINFLLL